MTAKDRLRTWVLENGRTLDGVELTDDDEQRVKIFPNEEFGFLRITVERPLRLKWEVTDASADALLADGNVGFYAKVHHAAIDGMSGVDLLAEVTRLGAALQRSVPGRERQALRSERAEAPSSSSGFHSRPR
mgnify:CR=1 FL=1